MLQETDSQMRSSVDGPVNPAKPPTRIRKQSPGATGLVPRTTPAPPSRSLLHPSSLAVLGQRIASLAVAAAQEMGWEIVASAPAEGRLEATDTTFWFGFKDDVVVRVSPAESGSRIDVRSVSRVGKSDVGTNAKRIVAYLARIGQNGT